jgi:hypothetical protein
MDRRKNFEPVCMFLSPTLPLLFWTDLSHLPRALLFDARFIIALSTKALLRYYLTLFV